MSQPTAIRLKLLLFVVCDNCKIILPVLRIFNERFTEKFVGVLFWSIFFFYTETKLIKSGREKE
jgi:hypothetical protein